MGLFSTRLSAGEMAPLCRQLATSYDAGIPILQSLELLGRGASSRKISGMLRRMYNAIKNGATLAEAARAEKDMLPEFFVEVVGAGEIGGRLDVMLKDLANYYEDQQVMKRAVLASLVYPAFQLGAAWFLGSFSLMLVSHMHQRGFSLGVFFRQYLMFQAAAIFTAFVLFWVAVALSRIGVFQHVTGFIKNFIWPIRPITRKYALARFFRGMSLLIGAGLSMSECIKRSAALTMNPAMEQDLLLSVPVIMNGGSLVEAFDRSRYLSDVGRQMLLVGEKSGNLEDSLHKVAEWHFDEARSATRVAMTVMGVTILLLLAALIGYIVITFYSRLYGGMMQGL
jgi:type IV pilus assembly protein PilC